MDPGTFVEYDVELVSADPLEFKDSKRYPSRIKESQEKTGQKDAILCAEARIEGQSAMVGIFEFNFMGGSLGSVVGEKITRLIERAVEKRIGVVIFCASGGARMQEGILSLMQMAKTSAALAKLQEAKIPYISVLTDTTTGGVSASIAMLGDIIIAEPLPDIHRSSPVQEKDRERIQGLLQKACQLGNVHVTLECLCGIGFVLITFLLPKRLFVCQLLMYCGAPFAPETS